MQAVPEIIHPQTWAILNRHSLEYCVAHQFGLQESDIFLRTRKLEVRVPRQVLFFIRRVFLNESLKGIMRRYKGQYDHSTVQHSRKKINDLIITNKDVRIKIGKICADYGILESYNKYMRSLAAEYPAFFKEQNQFTTYGRN